ncbi:hypothetical protein NKR23_g4863 [Pleurostoma richardsiae]|uniref:Prokaryotic-type class I peptide chain release factors domain-containing protein n=1 Tax=Pleurostoma richardsiae TaxID=41990 RepID=A0AA38VUL2_9PEZI|nr:hypothetical protein NKR23_g4863 [Pleurostoma richardsiae]
MRPLLLRPFSLQQHARLFQPLLCSRSARYQAHDAGFDIEQLAEARKWHGSFQLADIPKGSTTFARSSGPGGQHVNKTETKAMTSWPVSDLLSVLPKLMHPRIRSSRYYSKSHDAISIQAQTQRSRTANAEENREKLFEELRRIYQEAIPGESDPSKQKKYEAVEKSFHEARVKAKKQQSSKKASRRGGSGDY